jgi:hypothetical protein
LTFVPGYDNGNAPFGKWPAMGASAMVTVGDNPQIGLDHDFAPVRLTAVGGKKIQDVTGAEGICFYCTNQTVKIYGERPTSCSGTADRVATDNGDGLLEVKNCPPSTAGLSAGGPWLAGDGDLGPTILVSVSVAVTGNSVLGPFIGDSFRTLYDAYNKGA